MDYIIIFDINAVFFLTLNATFYRERYRSVPVWFGMRTCLNLCIIIARFYMIVYNQNRFGFRNKNSTTIAINISTSNILEGLKEVVMFMHHFLI